MTTLSQALLSLACFVIAVSSIVAIFHPRFDDTLLQRAGLCLAASGAVVVMYQLFAGRPADRAVVLTLEGSALYGGATVFKAYLQWRCKA